MSTGPNDERRLSLERERLGPYVDAARENVGWDFSRIGSARRLGPRVPWNYVSRARGLVKRAGRVLDIGTGGGERFEKVLANLRCTAIATEAWPPNVPIAATRLGPSGAHVFHCEDHRLPFADESFDAILNSHAAFDPRQISQILRAGGSFYTEQISSDHWKEVPDFFSRATSAGEPAGEDKFEFYQDRLRAHGLEIERAQRNAVPAAYRGLGDFVFMLCVASWTIPRCDPLGSHLQALLEMEKACRLRTE